MNSMGENSQTLNDVNDMENRSNQDFDNGIPAAFSQLINEIIIALQSKYENRIAALEAEIFNLEIEIQIREEKMMNYEAYSEHIHKHLRLRNTELAIQLAQLQGFTVGLLRRSDDISNNGVRVEDGEEDNENDEDYEYTDNTENHNGIDERKDSQWP